ncbi:MAG: FAD-dependent oxidoreductase [Lentisphaerae bacterium]|nr:FAD-dependent oxidoreductase [Lentisphaerota bacterium]
MVDATGSGRVTELAGGQVEGPGSQETPQPMSLLFRMAGVSFEEFLRFVKENPAEFLLAENPVYGVTPPEAAQRVHDGGLPYAALSAGGALLGGAIAGGRVQPCTAFFITPTSRQRREVCINATRISSAGLLDARETSCLLLDLAEQVHQSVAFLRASVPGFSRACLSSVAHRIGVRETKRIVGDESLTEGHVLNAVKSSEGVAKGAHHVDVHGSGTKQIRKPVHGGGTYDIPFGSLIPKGLRNVIAAGRCISSDRSANGSLRLMGTCMATGQAAGTMASLLAESRARNGDVRDLSVTRVREVLRQDGAILDGTQ